MILDSRMTEDDLDRQLGLLGGHREQATAPGPTAVVHELPGGADRRWAVLAVAAAAVVLLASGAFLAARAGDDNGAVDAVGQADTVDRDADSSRSSGGGPSDSTGGDGIFTPPSRYPSDAASGGSGSSADEAGDGSVASDSATTAATDSAPTDAASADGTTTSSDSTATESTAADTTVTTEPPPPADGSADLDGIDDASTALSDSTSAMVELTAGLAGGGSESDATAGDERGAANDLAAGVTAEHPNCASPQVNPDWSLTIVFSGCRAHDGRSMSGTLIAKVTRWVPFELRVTIVELIVGKDRLWMDATITYPAAIGGRPVEPVLRGEILTESKGEVTHIDGTAVFRPGRTVLDAKVGYVSDSRVVGGDSVIYRPGQTVVAATVTGLTVTKGQCTPSSGRAAWQVFTVTGIDGGGSDTTDADRLQLRTDVTAEATYRASSPIDGKIDLRVDGIRSEHRLPTACG